MSPLSLSVTRIAIKSWVGLGASSGFSFPCCDGCIHSHELDDLFVPNRSTRYLIQVDLVCKYDFHLSTYEIFIAQLNDCFHWPFSWVFHLFHSVANDHVSILLSVSTMSVRICFHWVRAIVFQSTRGFGIDVECSGVSRSHMSPDISIGYFKHGTYTVKLLKMSMFTTGPHSGGASTEPDSF